MESTQTLAPAPQDTRFFGHPLGLSTLFFTEVGERLSYYGMRALLIVFMTTSVAKGGLGFDVARAGAIYGLYTSMVYLLSLPGGWLADRILGLRKAVLYGGILIAFGQFCLAVPTLTFFYLGLVLVVFGTGLLKPNVSTIVGHLYTSGDHRRDAGFSIFYMGINLGALIAPLTCGVVGQKIDFHLGFGLAGVGMVLGLIQYVLRGKYLGDAGLHPVSAALPRRQIGLSLGLVAALLGILAVAATGGWLRFTAQGISDAVGFLLIAIFLGVFGWLLLSKGWTTVERKRFLAIAALFIASALFWSAFEQAGSTLTLFAERSTEKIAFGISYPSSVFQSANSAFMMPIAPFLAWLWVRLGTKEPSSPAKFSLGLIFVGLGFVVVWRGALLAGASGQVSSLWLWTTYLFHTVGELCLSPVGLSAMTKLAPAKVGGLMMGVWFMSISVGNYLGGRMAALYETFAPSTLFAVAASFAIGLGLVLALLVKPLKRLMGGVN